jgi:hypothetical protein
MKSPPEHSNSFWPSSGLSERIVMDNGREFHSSALVHFVMNSALNHAAPLPNSLPVTGLLDGDIARRA